jgi:hypothetical protein
MDRAFQPRPDLFLTKKTRNFANKILGASRESMFVDAAMAESGTSVKEDFRVSLGRLSLQ